MNDLNGDEDDPVVQEVPIYLSKRLEKQLYVFQYPLRPKNLSTEMNIRRCFFKPENKEVKLEMNVNVNSGNFDVMRAEQIAKEVDGVSDPKKKDDKVFENEIVDKVILASSKAVQDTSKYAIGIFNGKEYHITPLEGFLQLRSSLEHLDRNAKRKRKTEEAAPSEAKAVTVKFSKQDERAMKNREMSYQKLKEKSDAEKWIEHKWHKSNSTLSEVTKEKLFGEHFDNIGQAMSLTPSEYLKVLVPEDKEQAAVKPALPSNIVSLHSLRELPLKEQCRLLLKDARVIQFQQLMMLLTGGEGISADTLLRTLPEVAVLVRGNWVVKSEVLYPPNTFSATSGVPAEQMCRARDYVLYLFTKNQYVERRKVSSIIRLPAEEVKEIFTGISKLRHNKGWELVLPNDIEFVGKHLDLVQKQHSFWEQRAQELSDLSEGPKEKKPRRKSKSVSEDVRLKKEPVSSDTDSGTEKNKSPVAARKVRIKKEAS